MSRPDEWDYLSFDLRDTNIRAVDLLLDHDEILVVSLLLTADSRLSLAGDVLGRTVLRSRQVDDMAVRPVTKRLQRVALLGDEASRTTGHVWRYRESPVGAVPPLDSLAGANLRGHAQIPQKSEGRAKLSVEFVEFFAGHVDPGMLRSSALSFDPYVAARRSSRV